MKSTVALVLLASTLSARDASASASLSLLESETLPRAKAEAEGLLAPSDDVSPGTPGLDVRSPEGRVYHVALNGDDSTGDGSQARPYRTVAKAADVVPAHAGHTIQVGAGTFDEMRRIVLKERVNLLGAGLDVTLIRGGEWDGEGGGLIDLVSRVPDPSGAEIPAFEHEGKAQGPFIRYLPVDSPQELSGFSMDGQNKGASGIRVVNRGGVNIHHVKIKHYAWAGIYSSSEGYAGVRNLRVSDFEISESSLESTSRSWGNITLRGTHEGALIQNGRIEHVTAPPRPEGEHTGPGPAFKALRSWEDTARKQDELRGSRLLNIVQRGKDSAPWARYRTAHLGFEFRNIGADGVEIAHCDFNAAMSLELNAPIDQYPYSFHVHHNRFKVLGAGVLALTSSLGGVERDDFDMTGNSSPWDTSSARGPRVENLWVNNNVFYLASLTPSLFVFSTPVDNFRFFNNTVIGTASPTAVGSRRLSASSVGSRKAPVESRQ